MTLTDREKRIIALTKQLVQKKVSKLPGHMFGHGYLWGYVQIRRAQKNGKVKEFNVKTLLASVCAASFNDAEAAALSVPGVSCVHINAD